MKRMIQLVAFTLVIFLWPGQSSTAWHQPADAAPAAFFPYTWYYDEDMTQPVGTVATVSAEMDRLRLIYPGNVFSSSYSSGLSAYEYGYYSYYPAAIIYSDLP